MRGDGDRAPWGDEAASRGGFLEGDAVEDGAAVEESPAKTASPPRYSSPSSRRLGSGFGNG
jgi:hypothetical protein